MTGKTRRGSLGRAVFLRLCVHLPEVVYDLANVCDNVRWETADVKTIFFFESQKVIRRYGKDFCQFNEHFYGRLDIIIFPVGNALLGNAKTLCQFNFIRLFLYRLCGFEIGKHVFIGMHCYLDDMCYDILRIGSDVTISYGVYFACHGKGQGHYPIVIADGAYIGMCARIISKNTDGTEEGIHIGKRAVIGACALVIVNANIICIYYNNLIAISLAAMRQPRNMADIVSAFIKFAYYNCNIPDDKTAVGIPCHIVGENRALVFRK